MGKSPNKNFAIGYSGSPTTGLLRPYFEMRGKVGREWLPEDQHVPEGANSEAVAKAGTALVHALNGQTRSRRKHVFVRMTGGELSLALRELDLSPTDLAMLFGTHVGRVMEWINAVEDIPHAIRSMLAAFEAPGALDRAKKATRLVMAPDFTEEEVSDA